MRKLYACLRVQDFAVAVVLRGRRSLPSCSAGRRLTSTFTKRMPLLAQRAFAPG